MYKLARRERFSSGCGGSLSLRWGARPAGLPLASLFSSVLSVSDAARVSASATASWLSEPPRPRRLPVASRVLSCPASSPRGGNRERRGSWIGSPRDPNGSLDKQVLDGWVSASSCPDGDFFLFYRVSQSLSIRMGSSLCRGAEFLSCLTACLFLLLRSEVFVVQITGVWLGHHSDPESSETLLIFFLVGFWDRNSLPIS